MARDLRYHHFMNRRGMLSEVMEQLGRTPEAVAATLAARKIRGVRNTIRHLNPIVRFVQQQLPLDEYDLTLVNGVGVAEYVLRLELAGGAIEETVLPRSVQGFLEAFNGGAYPELELTS